ncbi:BREX system Lon protease-like protein BrxL [Marinobacterium sedimentorum]|uniref:BREX system Lon protease-like protein BrxL n=1 Tax=Marinobacterium sedimentorum TaxID=2927804 RepID=UPI0020C5E287|nr:BREX system Lon protease-like protein BrxL [Marinobacterium sedimentorum]MCP8687155.1 BREX system Lon protease-like protein BrxL [Marinobacterium sedimentorum]
MDTLDQNITQVFDGKVVRKDLVHRIKKGTNVPTFVLEFLLARYCASDDEEEIQAGMEAVLESLQDNYVRPNEANKAQSVVATKGKHRFIDKVHVNYVEKDRRHWAALENFDSRKVAISEKFYRDNDRLLQGGLWCEVTIAYNEIEDDDYAFYIEDLSPIQLSRFNYDQYCEGRNEFSRDDWVDVVLRSVGLEPSKLTPRVKMHFIARLLPLVEPNFNFIELGPRGTGKSYFFSEFSPYSTLISGGQATKATLFYHNQRKKIGLVGFWDTVAFDEVGGIKVKDPDTIQIMKDFMANGRFSRGVEVIADASMAFVGNLDLSVKQIVNSEVYDLFQPLPKEFDLAIMDRFACYLPGWEMPKNSSEFLTNNYGFITDYLAEAFHYQLKHTNRYEEVSKRIRLGRAVEGRDEKGIKKTVAGLLKILHPSGAPSDEEFEQYVAYAVECRRRVKEQMNKRKSDDEFALINLSYIDTHGKEIVVYCPESKLASATQEPLRRDIHSESEGAPQTPRAPSAAKEPVESPTSAPSESDEEVATGVEEPQEQHFTIHYGATGFSYESIMGPYLTGAKSIDIEDPYIRATHQVHNLVRFCEACIKSPTLRKITLTTSHDDDTDLKELSERLEELKQSLLDIDIELDIKINNHMHDREIRIDNGWTVKIGRGLDFFQRPDGWFGVGANDLTLRKCQETKVDIYKS